MKEKSMKATLKGCISSSGQKKKKKQASAPSPSSKKNKIKVYSCREQLLESFTEANTAKFAALKASPSIVTIVSRDIPESMCVDDAYVTNYPLEYLSSGTGTLVDCQPAADGTFAGYILAPATILARTHGSVSQVDVYLSDGKLCKGEVLDCDFHYNLSVIKIVGDSSFKAANLRSLDDVLSDHTECGKFKSPPGTEVIVLNRLHLQPPLELEPAVLWSRSFPIKYDCNELHWLKDTHWNLGSGAVINYSGEIIGILFYDQSFLPANLVSRWWKHYKSCRKFCRPWHGMEVANLGATHFDFLELLTLKFPDITEGVVVTKVVKDSPAYCSGIRLKDVIVKSNGELVRSTLEFYEKIWDNYGKSVELNVLRESSGQHLNLNLNVGETPPDKFYHWSTIPKLLALRVVKEGRRKRGRSYLPLLTRADALVAGVGSSRWPPPFCYPVKRC